jgi:hypothetical protein
MSKAYTSTHAGHDGFIERLAKYRLINNLKQKEKPLIISGFKFHLVVGVGESNVNTPLV